MRTEAAELESWPFLLDYLPPGWEQLARDTGAVRRLRGFRDTATLLRLLLLHVAMGCSLRETVVLAREAGWAAISDVALLDRFRGSAEWFRRMAVQLLELESSRAAGQELRVRMVDASIVKEPGKTGSQWRLHYALTLNDLGCDQFRITSEKEGETLRWLRIQPNDVIVGDRAYSTPPGIAHVVAAGGHVLVRMKLNTLPLVAADGKRFDLLGSLRHLKVGRVGEWHVRCPLPEAAPVAGRVCAVRLSNIAARVAVRKLERRSQKKQKTASVQARSLTRYVVLFTTVPAKMSAADALENYRVRWQIELAFKRLKSAAGLGHLPKRDEESAKAWLHGKILTGLLIEKIIRQAHAVSPWGWTIA